MGPRLTKAQAKASSRNRMAQWLRETQERQRLACLRAQAEQREAHTRLALDHGLHPVTLPDLADDLYEMHPVPVIG